MRKLKRDAVGFNLFRCTAISTKAYVINQIMLWIIVIHLSLPVVRKICYKVNFSLALFLHCSPHENEDFVYEESFPCKSHKASSKTTRTRHRYLHENAIMKLCKENLNRRIVSCKLFAFHRCWWGNERKESHRHHDKNFHSNVNNRCRGEKTEKDKILLNGWSVRSARRIIPQPTISCTITLGFHSLLKNFDESKKLLRDNKLATYLFFLINMKDTRRDKLLLNSTTKVKLSIITEDLRQFIIVSSVVR